LPVLTRLVEIVTGLLDENGLWYAYRPRDGIFNGVHDYLDIEAGYILCHTEPAMIEVWINGEYNTSSWLIDEVVAKYYLADPSTQLETEFLNLIKDLSRLCTMIQHHDYRNLPEEIDALRDSIQHFRNLGPLKLEQDGNNQACHLPQ
jgi:hypothetical protein